MKKRSVFDRLFRVTVRCRHCGTRIRFPVNKGRIRVVCPQCRSAFVFSPRPADVSVFLRRALSRVLRYRADAGGYGSSVRSAHRSPYVKPVMAALLAGIVLAAAALSICDSRVRRAAPDGYDAKKTDAPAARPTGNERTAFPDAA